MAEMRGLFDWTDPSVGETRKMLIEEHGLADSTVDIHAREDGSHEGWARRPS